MICRLFPLNKILNYSIINKNNNIKKTLYVAFNLTRTIFVGV